MNMITIKEFLNMILSGENIPGEGFEQRLQEGRIRGWIEEQDLLNLEEALDRRAAARILHMYLRIVRGVKDAEDITQAYALRDLFDCRVCANHIAQVYVRGIMESVKIGDMTVFDVYGKVTKEEAEAYFERVKNI